MRRFLIGLLVCVLVLAGISAVHAATLLSGSVTITCTGVIDNGTSVAIDRDNTGLGQEAYRFRAFDGAGNLIYEFSNLVSLGTYPIGNFSYNIAAPSFNPITLEFISLAGNSLPEQLVFRIQGECPGLPLFNPPCVDIPAGSVVGRLTRTAQAFYEPGKQSPGLLLEAGKAYWAIGYDATGDYVKIVLACQYLWVEADAIGPNFEEPWLGRPLPDRVVN